MIQESQSNVRNGNENQYSRAMHETTEHKEFMVMRNGNHSTSQLTLNAPIATKVVCFSRLLKCLRSPYGKQCGPRSDCSYRSSLFWVHAVCFHTLSVSNVRQLFAADAFSRRHYQMFVFFLGALRVKYQYLSKQMQL